MMHCLYTIICLLQIWDVNSTGLIEEPIIDLFDLETPIHSVSINDTCELAAAGSEDGIAIWYIHTGIYVQHTNYMLYTIPVPCIPLLTRCALLLL
jgi:hypothetical protein